MPDNKKTENIGEGKAGPGRPKGAPNKATAAVKDMVVGALNGAHPDGGMAYLIEQAEKNPKAFLTLVGKIIPVQQHVQGDFNISEVGWVIRAKPQP